MAKDLAKAAADGGIRYFLISFVDLFGVLRAKLSPAAATGRTFERRTRPNPCSLFGQVSEADRDTVPLPVTGVPDAMSTARTRAALGVIAFEGTARPAGYHPSVKYWRTIAAAAAATGVA